MAFQLRGIDPKSYGGGLIRFNVWTWHRIWLGLSEIDKDLTKSFSLWYANSGQIVDEKSAIKMAEAISHFGYGQFARLATNKVTELQQHAVSPQTLVAALEFEIDPLIIFLNECGGFKIT